RSQGRRNSSSKENSVKDDHGLHGLHGCKRQRRGINLKFGTLPRNSNRHVNKARRTKFVEDCCYFVPQSRDFRSTRSSSPLSIGCVKRTSSESASMLK